MENDMTPPDAQEREQARLEVLAATGLLDASSEAELDALVGLARRALGWGCVAITLVERDWLHIKAASRPSGAGMPRRESLCTVAIENDDMLVVPDAQADARFRHRAAVAGPSGIRAYAGVPIRARYDPDSPALPLGVLCFIDQAPRTPDAGELALLQQLATLAEALIRPRFVALRAAELMVRHRQDLHDLTRAHRQFRQAERMADIGSWRLTLADNRVEWSDQVFAIHGLPPGETPPVERALDHYPAQSRALITAALERAIGDGEPFDVELDFLTAAGAMRRVRCMGEMEVIDDRPVALIGVFQDVTARFEAEQELRRSATIDELTRLTNRAGFNAIADERIAQAHAGGEPLALLLIDLDGFKLVNDRYGHLAGDEVLKLVGRRLGAAHWADCAPARLGGDEFVLMVAAERDSAAFRMAVDELLGELRHVVGGEQGDIAVSGTVGISWLEPELTRRDLLDRADQALYAAKRACPGTARVFGEARAIRYAPPHRERRAAAA